jgi:hypothetical protein
MIKPRWENSGLICDGVNIYPFKGAAKSDNEKFKTFDDNKDELGFAAKP